ncbi:coiled-coil domain-containing protein [Nonomuraea sp. NPDC050790]|uniref:coiled-coil domain-containing protein n=1 Tax=Nonomuraea sp. NPDC050790 TaxID=3364371 RepID=UPI0037ACAF7E
MAVASPATLAIGLITAAAVALTPATAQAAPKPSEKQLRAELKKLNTKVDTLIESYNGKRVALAKAKDAEKAAQDRLAAAEQALVDAERRVAEIAQLRYQGTGTSLPPFLYTPDAPGAAVLEQLTDEEQAVIAGVAAARDQKKKAADEAASLTTQIAGQAETVAKERVAAEGVIKDIKDKLQDLMPYGTGKRNNGSWAPELPSGSDNITSRMRIIRDEIKKTFNLPFEVGCYRSGGGGEHPLGRACDFMMSTGGSMPTAANQALGDQIAAWAIKNKDRFGVKYVIWKQRINMGSGWRAMSDRGSVTENHFDHPHISMH